MPAVPKLRVFQVLINVSMLVVTPPSPTYVGLGGSVMSGIKRVK